MLTNVTQWLDEIANKYPDKTAFADERKTMTFQEVRQKSIAIAEQIIACGLHRDPVAVVIHKSVDTLIAFLATAYSGNYYTVIDVDMPQSRVEKIFEVFQPKLVLTMHEDMDRCGFISDDDNVICLDDDVSGNGDKEVLKRRNLTCDIDLLYVLFTSGSTGTPKGVTISHRSVIDYIRWVEETFQITSEDTFGNQAPFYFDNSVFDIYTCIKTGATLEIIPKILFSQPVRLLEYIKEKKINSILWVPSALVLVANLHAFKKVNLDGILERVLFLGEVMPTKQLNIWRKHIPNAVYVNLYGPTETTVSSTYYILNRNFSDDEAIPIGMAANNTEVLVLNEQDKLAGVGEIGELCIRGTSLSMGYYNNPEKTKEVFVQNPLNDKYIDLIYRTGDLVKYNEYGEIIYVSRKDFQIKHMGHRIELGEIESNVSSVSGIMNCCCVYDEKHNRIVLVYSGKVEKETIKKLLMGSLPEYMIPAKYVNVETLPLNANGKIDRKKVKEQICYVE